jgi:hypothetical protein
MIECLERRFVLITAIVAVAATANYYFYPRFQRYLPAPVHSDGRGYFSYLPATFIEKDLSFNFLFRQRQVFRSKGGRFPVWFDHPESAYFLSFVKNSERNTYVLMYGPGEAILVAPFFLVGHLLTRIFGETPNGWTLFYQLGLSAAAITCLVVGIYLLQKVLRRYFSTGVTLLTLICIVFGTNLFNYGTVDGCFNHIYSFFAFACLIHLVPRWYEDFSWQKTLLLGLVSGLIPLIRLPNAIVLLFIPLYGICSWTDLKERLRLFAHHPSRVLVWAATAGLTYLPQMLYWRYATGRWLYWSYQGFGFLYYKEPRFFEVLLGVNKGLFFWFPILLLALVGLLLMRGDARKFQVPSIVYLALQSYLVSSWATWWYGWTFGHRAFIESQPIFALGLASLFAWAANVSRRWLAAVSVVSLAATVLCCLQLWQYWLTILPPEGVTWPQYKERFLRFDKSLELNWHH